MKIKSPAEGTYISPKIMQQSIGKTAMDENNKGNSDNNKQEWKLITRNKCKTIGINKRPPPKIGTNTLKAVQPSNNSRIFVSKLNVKTEPKDIIRFLNKHYPGDEYHCIKMKTRRDHTYSSFRLGVQTDKKQIIMGTDLWPQGTILNQCK